MTHRNGIRSFIAAALLIGVSYASCFAPGGAPPWSAWTFALGTSTMMVASMMIGALRADGRASARLAIPFLVTWSIVFGGFGAALLLPADTVSDGLWLGLPRRAAIIIYGIGVLPLLFLPVAYSRAFDDFTLSDDDLERVRAAAAARREAGAAVE